MDKLRMQTREIAEENFKKLAEMFPNAVSETIDNDGKIIRAIDADVLRQEISSAVVEGREERYQFTWPGKREAILLANSPITKTLRPCKKESVDFDNTQNLYIEGDNLEVLKLLQEPYLGKVKMIYIDPPYNTGKDFIYNDKFVQAKEDFEKTTGARDEKGNQMVPNPESNGRFHSDWCSMIYPRLKLAKDLLSDDGVIFISIDDHEQENLKKICDEIWGRGNFIAQIIWKSKSGGANDSGQVVIDHEYVLVYAKSVDKLELNLDKSIEATTSYNFEDKNGRYALERLDKQNLRYSDSLNYDITGPDGKIYKLEHKNPSKPNATWRWSQETVRERYAELVFKDGHVYTKNYEKQKGQKPRSLLVDERFGRTRTGGTDLIRVLGEKAFSYPKPVSLIHHIVSISSNKDSIILDFFSGSATTAHAVMKLNAEDGGHRKFIMVQVPPDEEDEEGDATGENENICEIGKTRIRNAGEEILKENPSLRGSLDVGFRVLRLDSSNMEDVYYDPASAKQGELSIVNVKTGRTSLDLLFQVMLEFDKPLSSKIEETEICGKTVFKVDGDDMICCLDEGNISDEVVEAITKLKPLYAIFRDSSFADDSVRVNCDQLFAKFSPKTVYRVI